MSKRRIFAIALLHISGAEIPLETRPTCTIAKCYPARGYDPLNAVRIYFALTNNEYFDFLCYCGYLLIS